MPLGYYTMEHSNEYSSSLRAPEYQVVLIIEYDDGRMFPLTETTPKCLLPIANKPLLAYQLDMFTRSGIEEIYIVAPVEYKDQLTLFLSLAMTSNGSTVKLICVEEMLGSAEGLRAVSEYIRGDFICVHSDIISQYPLGELTRLHKFSNCDLTLLLSVKDKKEALDPVDQEYILISDSGRVVMKTAALELDDYITISKGLLHKSADYLHLRTDLLDLGLYVMSHWILSYVLTNKKISSIKADLLPYIIRRQFQPKEYLYANIPALTSRKASLLESWLVMNDRGSHLGEEKTIDGILQRIELNHHIDTNGIVSASGISALNSVPSAASVDNENATGLSQQCDEDLLRCYAMVYDPAVATATTSIPSILTRVINIPIYLNLNR